MSRPIEQALTSLIPRHPGSLPPELIELASSLLAQSRSKISNLRSDEEIGRTYACANLACERLKIALNLPTIEPRPPCPPKVYKKLYNHLDQLLTSTSSRRRPKSNQATPVKALPQKQTPVKEKSLEGFRSNRTPKRALKFGSNKKETLPKWVGHAIRKVCVEFEAGKAVPHVWAGVESVKFLPCPKDAVEGKGRGMKQNEMMEGKLPGLVATVFLFVFAALESKNTSAKELFEDKKRLLAVLKGLKDDDGVLKKVWEEEEWEGWNMEGMTLKKWVAEIDEWIEVIIGNQWLEMEWRTNIVDGSGASGKAEGNEDLENDKESDEESEKVSERMRRTGLGTMMQAKFDYLSDEKREAYAIWKKGMLARLDDLAADNMDTTEG
ncbi:hypothetical protein D0Z07_8025 [Hyphodiscus hymeniophilus]|uniref:ORC6 first cyclin-like domain-containing protein n=1 Tax=Hyphodiscus hymeniophilus TaxID=353542 RepID=A0A9P6VDW9_9HELO|nr:hypothetical protein D0Z07_8025 [Hyphodiscus hymeniophilus]